MWGWGYLPGGACALHAVTVNKSRAQPARVIVSINSWKAVTKPREHARYRVKKLRFSGVRSEFVQKSHFGNISFFRVRRWCQPVRCVPPGVAGGASRSGFSRFAQASIDRRVLFVRSLFVHLQALPECGIIVLSQGCPGGRLFLFVQRVAAVQGSWQLRLHRTGNVMQFVYGVADRIVKIVKCAVHRVHTRQDAAFVAAPPCA